MEKKNYHRGRRKPAQKKTVETESVQKKPVQRKPVQKKPVQKKRPPVLEEVDLDLELDDSVIPSRKRSKKEAQRKEQKIAQKKTMSPKKKRANLISNIILVLAIIVFCVSAFQLIKILKGYLDGRSEYDKIRDLAITSEKKDGEKEEQFRVNFDELKAINPDTIGWIRFDPEPSVISYPVVQGTDNAKYLKKTFSDNENTLGAIFLNVDNRADFSDRNSIVYGHRMKDGSMFRHLQDYEDQAFWEANPYFYIYTPDGREITYHIYSAGLVKDTSDTYLTVFESDEAYQEFLNMTKEVSLYDTGVELTTEDTIVTLSTCTSASDDNRFVVRGVKEKEVNLNE